MAAENVTDGFFCIMYTNTTHPLHESLEEAQDLVGGHSTPFLRTHVGVKTCNLQRSLRRNGAANPPNKIISFSAAMPQAHRTHSGRRAKRTLAIYFGQKPGGPTTLLSASALCLRCLLPRSGMEPLCDHRMGALEGVSGKGGAQAPPLALFCLLLAPLERLGGDSSSGTNRLEGMAGLVGRSRSSITQTSKTEHTEQYGRTEQPP